MLLLLVSLTPSSCRLNCVFPVSFSQSENGFIESFFSPCLSAQPSAWGHSINCSGMFCFQFPLFRCFRLLSSSKKWGCVSPWMSLRTIAESSILTSGVTFAPEDICHCLETFLFVTTGGSGCSRIS